jgi:hypothetical protein
LRTGLLTDGPEISLIQVVCYCQLSYLLEVGAICAIALSVRGIFTQVHLLGFMHISYTKLLSSVITLVMGTGGQLDSTFR